MADAEKQKAALELMLEASHAYAEVKHLPDDDPEAIKRKADFQQAKTAYWNSVCESS